jgi:thiol-disulfide isomerase/thioredoxin
MKLLATTYLFLLPTILAAQTITLNVQRTALKLATVNVHISDFAHFDQHDTVFTVQDDREIKISLPYNQPQFIRLVCTWENKRKSFIEFLASSASYKLEVDTNLKLSILNEPSSPFLKKHRDHESQKKIFYKIQDSLISKVDFSKSVSQAEKKIGDIKDSIATLIDKHNLRQYEQNLDNQFGLYALCQYANYPSENLRTNSRPDTIETLLAKLYPNVQKSTVAHALQNKLALARTLMVGQKFNYDILLNDTVGSKVDLSTFKNKYLFIDFWATWCLPCRIETPFHISVHSKYQNQNFQIISISLDEEKQKENWIRTISKDKTGIWPQFSDFNKKARTKYNIKFIPANLLINDKGIIIARDLRGAELPAKLKEVFPL